MIERAQKSWVAVAVLFFALSSLPAVAADESEYFGVGDLTIPASYNLAACKGATEMDCIESVGVILPSGELRPATFNGYRGGVKSIDPVDGDVNFNGQSVWNFGGEEFLLSANLESPVNNIYDGHKGSSLKMYPQYPNWRNNKFKIVVRTSWLRPMNVQVKAENANFIQEAILGGNRWTIEGNVMSFSDYDTGSNPSTAMNILKNKMESQPKADFDVERIEIGIHHAGKDSFDSYWPPVCADQGYSVQSNNTNATGDPVWTGESLEFAVFAPHLKSNGEINTGYFRFAASHKFLDCKFPGNLLTKSPKVEIQIIDEGVVQNIATTKVDNSNGMLIVEAKGFHFSSPKILVKPVAPTQLTASDTAIVKNNNAKKTTITCVKGRATKKITSQNPKCPKGYSLKKK